MYSWRVQNSLLDAWTFNVYVANHCTVVLYMTRCSIYSIVQKFCLLH